MPAGADARAETRRAAFFEAAEPLFERYGYRKTTIEDVCRAAGASKRTFYEVFTDKPDLASRLILHVSQGIVARWNAAVTPRMTAREKLDRFIDEYVRLGREHRFFGQMMSDPDWLSAFGKLKDESQFRVLVDVLRGILEEGVRRREFRRMDPEATTWIVYALLDTVYYMLPATGAMVSPFEDATLAREVRAFVTNALLLPGRKTRP